MKKLSSIATDDLQVKLLGEWGDELSTLTADNLELLLKRVKKTVIEHKARELLKQETTYYYSYN